MERDYRPLIVALALSAAMLVAGWWLGVIGESAPVYIPTFFDQIRPGMTVDELKTLGGLPHDPDAPGGPPHFEFRGDVDRGKGVVYGDPFVADTQFVRGQLVRFELRTSDSYAGAPIDHGDLLELVPVLAEAKMLRRGYSAAALVEALGEGVRVARIVDTEHGAIDVFRWDVALEGRRVARLEASVAAGQVIEHHLTE